MLDCNKRLQHFPNLRILLRQMLQQTKIPRLEFVKQCGIDNRTLTTLAKRGKLIIETSRCDKCDHRRKPCTGCKEKEFIDLSYKTADGIELNREFYQRYTEESAPKIEVPKKPVGRPATPPEEKQRKKEERTASVNPVEKTIQSENSKAAPAKIGEIEVNETSSEALLTKINKLRTIQEKEVTIRIKEMEETRIRGESLPTKVTEEMITIMAESMKRSYTDANEKLIIIMADRLGAQAHDTAFMRKKSIEAINTAIDASVEMAKNTVRTMAGNA